MRAYCILLLIKPPCLTSLSKQNALFWEPYITSCSATGLVSDRGSVLDWSHSALSSTHKNRIDWCNVRRRTYKVRRLQATFFHSILFCTCYQRKKSEQLSRISVRMRIFHFPVCKKYMTGFTLQTLERGVYLRIKTSFLFALSSQKCIREHLDFLEVLPHRQTNPLLFYTAGRRHRVDSSFPRNPLRPSVI